jgi:hypothetical protein
MRFPIDVVFLDQNGLPRAIYRAVPPRRVLFCQRAAAVIETSAGGTLAAVAAWEASRASGIAPRKQPPSRRLGRGAKEG